MKDDILHAPLPMGPAGRFGYHVPGSNMLMSYSRNQKAAKEFLREGFRDAALPVSSP